MQLLSTEMANQDPLQPMDPTQTMTQLAQFTNLQQTNALAQSQSLATGNSYLGSQVTVSNGAGQTPLTGTVTGVDTSGVASGTPPAAGAERRLAGVPAERSHAGPVPDHNPSNSTTTASP